VPLLSKKHIGTDMETQLSYDNKGKHLDLFFKERFVTDSNVQLKVAGSINTKTGAVDYQGTLRKFVGARPRFTSSTAAVYNQEKQKVRFGAGITYSSKADQYLLGLTARKQWQIGDTETWLKVSQDAYYNPQVQQPHGVSRVQLSKAVYNFTDTQDVRLLLGYRAHIDHQGNVVGAPYAQIRENNWSVNTTFKNDWQIRYDL
jgi:hypothetical protein